MKDKLSKSEIIYFIWCYLGGILGFFIMCRSVGYFTGSVVLNNIIDKVFTQSITMFLGLVFISFLLGVSIWGNYGK